MEVQYDSTSREGGFPYLKGHAIADCPHITTTEGVDIDYLMYQRNANGFHHNYTLFGTADNTAYQYRIAYDYGANWSGPRIQRIRLYYSKESAADPLTLPSAISASGYSKALRYSDIQVSLTASGDPSLIAGSSKCDVGIVVRNFRRFADNTLPDGHKRDSVIFLNDITPTVEGSTLTYHIASLRADNNRQLDVEYGLMPFVRIKGDTTNPITEMDESSAGTNWRSGAETSISRPAYTFTDDTNTNYVYATDAQATLKATVRISSPVAQAYDLGFIYRESGGDDDDWVYTYYNQNGSDVATIQGFRNAGANVDTTFTATLTSLTPGQAYEYKPVIRQHAACKFGTNASGEAPTFTYLLYGDGYDNSNTRKTTMAGPVVTVHTGDHTPTSAYYTEAEKGQVTPMHINISHLDPDLNAAGANFTTGIMYYSTNLSSGARQYYRTRYDRKTIGTGTFSNGVWSNVNVYGSNARFLKNGIPLDQTGYLTVADVDGEVVHYRPYFAFLTGGTEGSMVDPGTEGYKYVMASDWGTFTCPVPSASSGDYLWQGAKTADLKGTIGIDANGANCKMEIGYRKKDEYEAWTVWTTAEDDITTTGLKTISSAALSVEGEQTVQFGVRRHGSSDASTWKTLDIALDHPFSMVTTYSSSWYENQYTATVAGSFTTKKVAANNLVEYGFYYKDHNNTPRTCTIYTAPQAAQDYYTINITDGVSTAVTRDKRLVGWFFARLVGSSSVPTSHWTKVNSARSGKQMMTHSWDPDQLTTIVKRLYVNFNTNPRDVNSSPTNPFLPMNNNAYINDLSVTYANLCQDKKARVVGGLDIEFHMTHGASGTNESGSAIIASGVCRNADGGHGRMRVYAADKDDYILLPCPSGVKIGRVVAWMWGLNQKPYTTASKVLYAFLTSNEADPAHITPSFASKVAFSDVTSDLANWYDSLNESNYPYATYQGQPLRLHFCGQTVTGTKGGAVYPYSNITVPPDRTELQIPGFWIDYVAAP